MRLAPLFLIAKEYQPTGGIRRKIWQILPTAHLT